MSDPTFGISITRIDNEPRPAVWSDMAIVGLVGTAPDADAQVFPLDTPVFLYSDDRTKLTALGATGTLQDAVTGINDQLGEFQVAARIVVVRVERRCRYGRNHPEHHRQWGKRHRYPCAARCRARAGYHSASHRLSRLHLTATNRQ